MLVVTAWPVWAVEADLILRDVRTGLALQGDVFYRPVEVSVEPLAGVIDALLDEPRAVGQVQVHGRGVLPVDGVTAVRAEVEGYHPLHAVLRGAGRGSGWTLMLDPVDHPVAPRPREAGRLLISGWVHDRQDFEPVPGARVETSHDAATTFSDANGYFELEVRPPAIREHRPESFAMQVSHPDFPDWRRDEILAGAGALEMQVPLGALHTASAHRAHADPSITPEPTTVDDSRQVQRESGGDQPPASVVVGFADAACSETCGRPGCLNACQHSCVFSLETYTRRGVPNEWFGSWNADALAAGAVAYRSFGAWHAFNPLPEGEWDICSNACCQVNNDETQSGTDQAVASTAGLMLVREGSVFRSEYSAQNNNLLGPRACSNVDCDADSGQCACGDGYAGSPSTDWSCLADPPSVGDSCFGHGRGMSQWGNQFWTLEDEPKNWKRQLDHYYNADGEGSGLRTATISQVFVIDEVRVVPASVQPGEAFTIELDVRNLASEPHAAVLIGASVRRPGDDFIDDPDNDRLVALPSGVSTVERSFSLPANLPNGLYDLWVALRIDVDRDGAISSADLVQQQVTLNQVFRVDEGLFRDRFELPLVGFE
ncbi:hypothetical protein IC757_14520 [Wenzhouxiangella sp. AB-CW3]|uniref:carboxypeptidase-like regulatory domain-containing protein n=1 Tax=Wenzhouxiangella sp. AB-CW3 TaxID=2771012 RepID=UPI00168B62A7|nr:carboxypeptidase-like regulatory domain-containing protein [Wenzhouxiangella sp. AB-CW3]QOC22214.1 hypothetical protein IC757_14520 [Wenzhouxiangella sp. AB-CW3]